MFGSCESDKMIMTENYTPWEKKLKLAYDKINKRKAAKVRFAHLTYQT